MQKTADASRKGAPMKGVWDSIHVVEVQEAGKNGIYNLTSTGTLFCTHTREGERTELPTKNNIVRVVMADCVCRRQ